MIKYLYRNTPPDSDRYPMLEVWTKLNDIARPKRAAVLRAQYDMLAATVAAPQVRFPFQGPRTHTQGFSMPNHPAHDWSMANSTVIHAAHKGQITRASYVAYYAYSVTITGTSVDGQRVMSLYAHFRSTNPYLVKVGDWVEAGQPIGYSDNTGNSTGPHLHLEIRTGGMSYPYDCVNPTFLAYQSPGTPTTPPTPPPPPPTVNTELGADFSHYQGTVDWNKTKAAGLKYALLKGSEGATYVDPTFARNYAECQRVRMPTGYTHFVRMNVSAAEQFNNILKVASGKTFDKGIGLDCESTDGKTWPQVTQVIQQLSNLIVTNCGIRPVMYGALDFLNHLSDWPGGIWDDHLLWLSDPDDDPPTVPNHWKNTGWARHQYTFTGDGQKYGAQSRGLDLNREKIGLFRPMTLGKPPTTPPPPPPPQPPATGAGNYRVHKTTSGSQATKLSIYAMPNTGSRVVGSYDNGLIVYAHACYSGWAAVHGQYGRPEGYLLSKYLVRVS